MIMIFSYFLLFWAHFQCAWSILSFDPFQKNPRVLLQDGNLVFISAAHKNISFQSPFGHVLVNGIDLTDLLQAAHLLLSDQNLNLNKNSEQSEKENYFSVKNDLKKAQSTINEMLNNGKIRPFRVYKTITEFRKVKSQLNKLVKLLAKDECKSNPCENEGTCFDSYDTYICHCTDGWKGKSCTQDVDECALFKDTSLGCQNGAECVNTPGSYRCICRPGFTGVHCATSTSTGGNNVCLSASNTELCGHGLCVPLPLGNNQTYRCVCEAGWKSGSDSPACIVDIDECETHRKWINQLNNPSSTNSLTTIHRIEHVCSINPPVACFNTLGSFHCGPCPEGYIGNGQICWDINECELNNGGCSQMPLVQCVNTQGSRTCGPCPAGFTGDGQTCSQDTGVEYTSSTSNYDICDRSLCNDHGQCITSKTTKTRCLCDSGWSGERCDQETQFCGNTNPCKNNATCERYDDMFICHCTSEWTGPWCEQQKDVCGEYMEGHAGTISFPTNWNFLSNNKNILECEWRVHTKPGQAIQFNITKFHLSDSSNCEQKSLIVYDGSLNNIESQKLGQYCGDIKNIQNNANNITSIHNDVTWKLQIRDFVQTMNEQRLLSAKEGNNSSKLLSFEINWKVTNPSCGKRISLAKHGSINSPGYPNGYPAKSDCNWVIEVAQDKRIQIYFATLDIENSFNCSQDYVSIHDGETEDDLLLGKFCNKSAPAPLVTIGPYAYIHFHSIEKRSASGFHLTFNEIENEQGCGKVFTKDQGEITWSSDSLDDSMISKRRCEYRVRLKDRDSRILVHFEELTLSTNPTCSLDNVELFDGLSTQSLKLGRFCKLPDENNPQIFTSGPNLLIRFQSIGRLISFPKLFKISYEKHCGNVLTAPSGIITSPNFPLYYSRNSKCTYEIIQPQGRHIQLSFLDFNMGTSSGQCTSTVLKVRNGSKNRTLLGQYCGNSKPPTLISTFNKLIIEFESGRETPPNPLFEAVGYRINYTSIDVGCGGLYTNSPGEIKSPSSFSGSYKPRSNCNWVLQAPADQVVRLTFNSFILEKHAQCQFDYVQVLDFKLNEIGRYCGRAIPPTIQSTDNELIVHFATDDTVHLNGFSATYVFINKASTCGGHIASDSGEITSPDFYDRNFYAPNLDCNWHIITSPGRQIRLNFTYFKIESTNCAYDRVEIYNGPEKNSPLLAKYCGTTIPPVVISHSNRIIVRFVSDASNESKGFRLSFDTALTGCGGLLNSPSGAISSPNYPQPYAANLECNYVIAVSKGSVISSHFLSLELDDLRGCPLDFVEIFDGRDEHQPRIGKYCGEKNLPQMFISSENALFVRFRSDLNSARKGFLLTYSTNCTNTLTGFRGVIESPNYPLADTSEHDCRWHIKAPIGNKLRFIITDLSQECYNGAQLSIQEISDDSNKTHTFCEKTQQLHFNTSGNEVFVIFKSLQPEKTNRGITARLQKPNRNLFRLEYYTLGCGGEFWYKGSGSLETPNYPNGAAGKLSCVWHINVRPGNKIKLRINDFDSTGNQNCKQRNLRLLGGPTLDSPELAKVCNSISQSAIFWSMGSALTIQLYNERALSWRGFQAKFTVVRDTTCGGEFTLESGTLNSPNFPAPYDPTDDCQYLIQYSDLRRVEVKIEQFNFPISLQCSRGALLFYDGESIEAPLIKTLCGELNSNETLIESSGNSLLIRLRGDGQESAGGFRLSYQSICGGHRVIESEETIVLTSPNYPHYYKRASNCTWTIATRQDLKLTVMATHVDSYLADQFCNFNYVSLYGGSSVDSPLLTRFCHTIPGAVITRGNTLTVRSLRSSFRLLISSANSACGGVIHTISGEIISPSYPVMYPLGIQCDWTLYVASGNRFMIQFLDFDITESDFCASDYVEMRKDSYDGPLIGRFCGDRLPLLDSQLNQTSVQNTSFKNSITFIESINANNLTNTQEPNDILSTSRLWIRFKTDKASSPGRGFRLSFSLRNQVRLSGESGSISSPLHPGYSHKPELLVWQVIARFGQLIKFEFDQMQLPSRENNDCLAYLIILDGLKPDSKQLAKVCGSNLPSPIYTTSSSASVFYASDGDALFSLRWSTVQINPFGQNFISYEDKKSNSTNSSNGCGGEFFLRNPTEQLIIKSPDYPNLYAANLNCTWTIIAPETRKLKVEIFDMNIEGQAESCYFDRLLVETPEMDTFGHQKSIWKEEKTFCGKTASSFSVDFSQLRLKFLSDVMGSGTGFNLRVYTACGGSIDARRPGSITHSTTTELIDFDSHCQWVLTARVGRTLRIAWKSLNVGVGPLCIDNFILLRNGGSNQSPMLGKGRYCSSADAKRLIPESTSNRILVDFQVVKNLNQSFELEYQEVVIDCGGNIDISDASQRIRLYSPKYPDPPPVVECDWIIRSPPTTSVRIDFDITQNSGNCPPNDKSITIFDGGSEHSPLLIQSCPRISSVSSTDNVMFIRFISSQAGLQDAFQAFVQQSICGGSYVINTDSLLRSKNYPKLYPSNLDCVYILKSFFSTFNLRLTLTALDLRDKVSSVQDDQLFSSSSENFIGKDEKECDRAGDVLKIRDEDALGPILGKYCGRAPNRTFVLISHSSQVYVRFRTNAINAGKGFQIRIRANYMPCGGKIDHAFTGVIRSPQNFENLETSRTCKWILVGEPGRRIQVKLRKVNLKKDKKSGSCIDTLKFSAAPNLLVASYLKPLNEGRECDLKEGEIITSQHSGMTIQASMEKLGPNEGFELEYDATQEAICGGSFNSTNGVFESLYFNDSSRDEHINETITCMWYLDVSKVKKNQTMSLIFDVIELGIENSQNKFIPEARSNALWAQMQAQDRSFSCDISKLMVGESGRFSMEYMFLPLKLCGNLTGLELFHVFRRMQFAQPTILLQQKIVPQERGVRILYQQQDCGGEFSGLGNFSSPGYPTAYPPNSLCQWTINTPEYELMRFTFLSFQLESDCRQDYVQVFAGTFINSASKLPKLCGTHSVPFEIETTSRTFTVIFKSDSQGTAPGFLFNLAPESNKDSCSHIFDDIPYQFGKTITSPKFPEKYENNMECIWMFDLSSSYYLHLSFVSRFDIEKSPNCSLDYVLIEQKLSNSWSIIGRYCGIEAPSDITTNSHQVRITFRTNENVTGDGFSLKVDKLCGGNLTDDEGIIESPNYPNSYDRNVRCNYLIQRSSFDFITVKVLDFAIFDCPMDWIMIYRSNKEIKDNESSSKNLNIKNDTILNSRAKILGPYCGQQKPPEEISNQKHLLIQFNSDSTIQGKGFKFHYKVVNCGGSFVNKSFGVIESPKAFHGSYFHNAKCIWKIETLENQTISLRFEEFDIEACGPACFCDFLQIKDGLNETAPNIATLCGSKKIPLVKSTTNQMTLTFFTDFTGNNLGFKAIFYTTLGPKQGCGGNLLLNKSGIIESPDPNNRGKYDSNLDCIWTLNAYSEFHVIKLTIEKFEMQNQSSNGECQDYLQVNDGYSANHPLIDIFCGVKKDIHFVSSSNYLFLYMRTDFADEYSGFRLKYELLNATCGERILVFMQDKSNNNSNPYDWKMITSPNWPLPYPPRIRCRWLFIMAGPIRVQLQIKDFQLNCSNNEYLQLSSNNRHEKPMRLCTNSSRILNRRFVGANGLWLTFNTGDGGTNLLEDKSQIPNEARVGPVRGFRIAYRLMSCNETYNTNDGFIISLNFPSVWSLEMSYYCQFSIQVQPGRTISLYFNEFLIGKKTPGPCLDGRMEVTDGIIGNAKRLGTLCGFTLPNPIFSTSNVLSFYVKSVRQYNLYQMTYTSSEEGEGCGGEFSTNSGLFTSPLFPLPYQKDKLCVWKLHSQSEHKYELKITHLELSSTLDDCTTNYVDILEGEDLKLAMRLCGNQEKINPFYSSSNYVEVQMKTSKNNTGNGFKISYSVVFTENPGTSNIFTKGQKTAFDLYELDLNKF